MLDERKLNILYAIISNYINSAEPIGSRTISKQYDLGISSATIRNEMSDLEEQGYLTKPYSSAGRIPSDKAYRLYVDTLLKKQGKLLKDIDEKMILDILNKQTWEVDDLIQNLAKILSKLTSYTTVVASPKMKNSIIKKLQLVSIDESKVLMVIISNTGIVKNTMFKIDRSLSSNDLNTISNFLNEKFDNLSVDEVLCILDEEISNELNQFRDIFEKMVPIICEIIRDFVTVDLYLDGITNILNFPEYKDIDKAKSFISFVEDRDLLLDILLRDLNSNEIDIIIGSENIYAPIKDLSIITTTYAIGDKIIGKVGLIGPTRMDYLNLINIIKSFSFNINNILND
jgi:heat-inducible transcriptional repressor